MPYPKEHTLRLRNSADFDKNSFIKTKGSGKGKVQGVEILDTINVVWGKLKGYSGEDDPVIPQALRFPITNWENESGTESWIKLHDLKGSFEPANSTQNSLTTNNVVELTENEMSAYAPIYEGDFDSMKLFSPEVIRINLAQGEFEYKDWNGKSHLVVPGVILKEGVHNKIKYEAKDLAKDPTIWNGVPVPVSHPRNADGKAISATSSEEVLSSCIGRFWNASYDDGIKGVKGEFWFDSEKLTPNLSSKILDGQMEVSTGLWGDHELVEGSWNGEQYVAILREYRPDHVAILPNEIGACSWEDGCGIRVNSNDNPYEGKEVKTKNMGNEIFKKGSKVKIVSNKEENLSVLKTAIKTIGKSIGLSVNELSHDDIRRSLNDSLRDSFKTPTDKWPDVWVREVYDDHFIYENCGKLYKQNYAKKDDMIEMKDTPIEVKIKTEYVVASEDKSSGEDVKVTANEDKDANEEVNENKEEENIEENASEEKTEDDKDINNNKEVIIMARKESIDKLIANKSFAEDDRTWLESLEEERFNKVVALSEEEEMDANDEEVNEEEEMDANEDVEETDPKKFLENSKMPKAIREMLSSGLGVLSEKKKSLIAKIVSVENSRFKNKAKLLENKSIDELEDIASLIVDNEEDGDFTANSGGVRTATFASPNINEKQADGTGIPKQPTVTYENGKPVINSVD